ncbi:MAG: tRNA uridine-5-carboxymethylaminomethyl(34) synthesis GTPase MnmE, partial [Methylophilaceae bacterium]
VNPSLINDVTIAAIASAAGVGGVGIIRISGSRSFDIAKKITGIKEIESHKVNLVSFKDQNGNLIDKGLLLAFKSPKSYTGEDVVEFQVHGGPTLLHYLLEETLQRGARIAEPGEFTKRAFLNNKIDLAQAEAVADIINASTYNAVINAASSLKGNFSFKINSLQKKIIDIRMYIEACLDFPDEDIDFIKKGQIQEKLLAIKQEIDELLLVAKKGQIIQDGFQMCLVGKPNVGKSTLINLFSQEDLAIVTDIPGTTRDPVRALINLSGIPIKIVDTAGIRETSDSIEKAGIDKTLATIQSSSLVLIVLEDEDEVNQYIDQGIFSLDAKIIWVLNKIDLSPQKSYQKEVKGYPLIAISAKFNIGIALLENQIIKSLGLNNLEANEQIFSARQRHIEALSDIMIHMNEAFNNFEQPELLAEELLLIQKSMSTVTGEFTADDLLGEIFSRFCIGK